MLATIVIVENLIVNKNMKIGKTKVKVINWAPEMYYLLDMQKYFENSKWS